MTPTSLEVTDQESAAVATHPRVTLADIEDNIAAIFYTTANDALRNSDWNTSNPDYHVPTIIEQLGILTICVLVMKNGFSVIGKAAPASPENFNRDLGRKFAYEDAVRQLWPLMGYELRERLYLSKMAEEALNEIPF